jgi:hypothetical protein
MRRLVILAGFAVLAAAAVLWPSGASTRAQANCFTQTGFCIDNPRFATYFNARGGADTFGFPISREFTFLGFTVQFFQGHIMQLQPDGSVATMNLLDEGLMPVTRVNGSTFPAADPAIVAETPRVGDPTYATEIVEFIRANAPETFNGQPVRFFSTFMNTVPLEVAFPGGGNPSLLPLLNLEIWGSVTSRPLADPSNPGFIYQRFQRSIMHYRTACQCTERILLADWFKTVILGTAPPDLTEDMAATPFINQWNPDGERGLNRPDELPNTNLANAFVPELPGFASPPAAPQVAGSQIPGPTATPGGTSGPTVVIRLSDDRPRQDEEFRITVDAEDPDGIQTVWWWATDTDDNSLRDTDSRNCRGATPCRESWHVSTRDTGDIVIHAQARDTQGNLSEEVTREIRVREREEETPTPTPTAEATPTPTAEPTATATPTS